MVTRKRFVVTFIQTLGLCKYSYQGKSVIVRLMFRVAYTSQFAYVQNHGMNDTTNQDAG